MLKDLWQASAQPAVRDVPGRTAAGALPVDDLIALRFAGPDVAKFLQGYLTCDTTRLSASEPVGAAVCNLKGRVVTFGWCQADAHGIVYLLHQSLGGVLAEFMKPYLQFSRTALARLEEDHLVVVGADAAQTGNVAAGILVRVVQSKDQLDALRATWVDGTRAYFDQALIEAGVPWLTAATSGEFLPQMLNLPALGAVSFDKGCYLGQEVVARAQHRGQVKRHLRPLTIRGKAPLPAPGIQLMNAEGRPVGVVIQAAAPAGGMPARCLAVLQDDAGEPFHTGAGELTLSF